MKYTQLSGLPEGGGLHKHKHVSEYAIHKSSFA